QAAEETGMHQRQVAGHDEVPLTVSVAQGGEDAAEGAFAGIEIRDAGELGVAYEGDAAGGGFDGAADLAHEGSATEGEQRFVPPHPGTAPAGQHVSRVSHKEMITLGFCGQARGPRFRY